MELLYSRMLPSRVIKTSLRQFATHQPATLYFNEFPRYFQMVQDAKSTARRSILIDHGGVKHIDLKTEFSNVETVYSIKKQTNKATTHLSLVEFKSEHDADYVVRQAKHHEGLLPVPLKVFQYLGKPCQESDYQDLPFPLKQISLSHEKELPIPLTSYSSLVKDSVMSMVALKLRFITLVNLEKILCCGSFEEYELLPFGSSTIDIGSETGDLDILVTRKENHESLIKQFLTQRGMVSSSKKPSQLVHIDRSLYSDKRENSGIKGTMRWFDYILREYMPLVDSDVQLISHAKVPIIRFTSRITSIDCDLSFDLGVQYGERDIFYTNYSGILMSQILYCLSRNNNLFVAVVIYLKHFGRLSTITSKEPAQGFKNFQFLSLIIFYLQQITLNGQLHQHDEACNTKGEDSANDCQKLAIDFVRTRQQKPLIPSFKNLLNSNITVEEDSIINLNDNQLNQLVPKVIIGFMEFYSQFDFKTRSLNLYDSKVDQKLDNSPIYVVNPMDRSKNICNNVNRKGLDNLIKQTKLALTAPNINSTTGPLRLLEKLMTKEQKLKQVEKFKDIVSQNDIYQPSRKLRGLLR